MNFLSHCHAESVPLNTGRGRGSEMDGRRNRASSFERWCLLIQLRRDGFLVVCDAIYLRPCLRCLSSLLLLSVLNRKGRSNAPSSVCVCMLVPVCVSIYIHVGLCPYAYSCMHVCLSVRPLSMLFSFFFLFYDPPVTKAGIYSSEEILGQCPLWVFLGARPIKTGFDGCWTPRRRSKSYTYKTEKSLWHCFMKDYLHFFVKLILHLNADLVIDLVCW